MGEPQAPSSDANRKATLLGWLLQSVPLKGSASAASPLGSDSDFLTWHRAIFAGGYPPTIVAAAAFHNRVRDGSVWFHSAMDTRKDHSHHGLNHHGIIVIPENCIG